MATAALPPLPAGDMLTIIKGLHLQAREGITLGTDIAVRDKINNIIIAGVGGSAIVGSVLNSICYNDKTPIWVCKGMSLPGWVNEKTLVIAISYSGETDETVAMYNDATKKACKILVVTSGGRLAKMAKQDEVPLLLIPRGLPPISALGYMLIPVLAILSRSNLVEDHLKDFEATVSLIEHAPYINSAQNLAKRIAGATPLIYATPSLEGVALRWKIALNDNAKVPAFANTMPEAAHTEILTFGKTRVPYHVILLHDNHDSLALKKRVETFKTIVKSRGTSVTDIEVKGASALSKILSAVHLGDFVSYFLAEESGVDPMSINAIDEYKAMARKLEGQK